MLQLNFKSGVPICDQIVNGFIRMKALGLVESGEQLPCDLLLLASGFSGCEAASLGAYEAVRQAGIPVLTAGDMASGASLVVLAIASGKQAAARADASLMGYTNIL